MTNDMKQHEAMIKQRLEQTLSSGELTQLAAFHARRIAEFQHERLVHLLVTMFFACRLAALGAHGRAYVNSICTRTVLHPSLLLSGKWYAAAISADGGD